MNIKVIIVWALVIVFLAGVGIFGMTNQDLLYLDDPYEPAPLEVSNEDKKCSAMFEGGQSIYEFNQLNMEAGGLINKFSITYKATSANVDDYTIANTISNKISEDNVSGVTAIFSGSIDDFQLKLIIDRPVLEVIKLQELTEDLNKLHIKVEDISSYDSYSQLIKSTSDLYTCE